MIGPWFFMHFSRSRRTQKLKLDPIAILSLLKRINSSDLDLGEQHISPEILPKGSQFFTNNSRSVMNQRLKFDMAAVIRLLQTVKRFRSPFRVPDLEKKKNLKKQRRVCRPVFFHYRLQQRMSMRFRHHSLFQICPFLCCPKQG